MYQRSLGRIPTTPPAVKNLIIINILFYMATTLLPDGIGIQMINKLGLHYWGSPQFMPHQFVTYMFLHGGTFHIFTNMFALWMFGRSLENDIGTKRFLIYFFITGIGAGLLQLGVQGIELAGLKSQITQGVPYAEMAYQMKLATVNIGASGAVFALLLAFGMMYPNASIYLFFIPIPIKAKYFVIGYGVIELMGGLGFGEFIMNIEDNIAHFAHLGGMIFGFFLLRYWKKKGYIFY